MRIYRRNIERHHGSAGERVIGDPEEQVMALLSSAIVNKLPLRYG